MTIPENLQPGARVTIQLQKLVKRDDGERVYVHDVDDPYNYRQQEVPRAAIVAVLPPIQKPDARVYHDVFGEFLTVVQHDAQSGSYVFRRDTGDLVVLLDDESVHPQGGLTAEELGRLTEASSPKREAPLPAPIEIVEPTEDERRAIFSAEDEEQPF